MGDVIHILGDTKVKGVRYALLRAGDDERAARLDIYRSSLPLICDAIKPYFGLPSMNLNRLSVGGRKYIISPVSHTSKGIIPDPPLDYRILTEEDKNILRRYLLFRYLCQLDTKPNHLRMRWLDSRWHLVSVRENRFVHKPLADSLGKYMHPLPPLSLPDVDILRSIICDIDPEYISLAQNIHTRWRNLRDQPPPVIIDPTPLPLELIP